MAEAEEVLRTYSLALQLVDKTLLRLTAQLIHLTLQLVVVLLQPTNSTTDTVIIAATGGGGGGRGATVERFKLNYATNGNLDSTSVIKHLVLTGNQLTVQQVVK